LTIFFVKNRLYHVDSAAWTLVDGPSTGDFGPIYSPSGSTPAWPGARLAAATWVDEVGKLWMLGGWGVYDNRTDQQALADLWSFDPGTGLWTFVQGSDAGNGQLSNCSTNGIGAIRCPSVRRLTKSTAVVVR
jgi:hypothetical protein